ncbi:MAG: hypothetical protein JRC89_08410 [Deltaproteobacteria bacterium]|nr:hypothetical protein [Deltaproteobacteria bacterium]
MANFNKISLAGKNNKMNIWVGVLKWEAFSDAESLVEKIGPGGHLVDLTDFSRLSLAKALGNFSHTVRSRVKLFDMEGIDLGTIPYKGITTYKKNITLNMQTDKDAKAPSIIGHINFDPDNPSEITTEYPLEIKTTEDKMVLNFEIPPSQFHVEFTKSGYLSFYIWKAMLLGVVSLLFLFYSINKIKKKMPIKL